MVIVDNFKRINTDKFDIKINGIQIIESEKTIEIYNDPFRTVPLFITRRISDNGLILFSNFEEFYRLEHVDKAVDQTGFWEIVLFGSALWTRTLYKKVNQMPGASRIIIEKSANSYRIERYWGFNVEVDSAINSIDKAADGLHEKLDNIFSKFEKSQRYVMGLSGGLDSRMTLAFLSRYVPKSNIELFTFGFSREVLEYQYAQEVARVLGFRPPKFHPISTGAYERAIEYLPQKSGGQIAINHCHIIDYLRTNRDNLKDKVHISTYYSDAIFGWDCIAEKKNESIQHSGYFKSLEKNPIINKATLDEITRDIENSLSMYDAKYNYSKCDEYKYLCERNQKFHIYLASIQNQFAPTVLPYANYELLQYCLSLPIEYRANKNTVEYTINKFFKDISSEYLNNISSRDNQTSK